MALGTNPLHIDTDGDNLVDGWEVAYDFNPLEAESPEVSEADPDQDGLTNWEESTLGTDPYSPDTDGDGISDKQENEQGTSPVDIADSVPPPVERVVPMTFSIDGDYASWEMRIQGLGEGTGGLSDSRLLKHHMLEPNAEISSTFLLRKGCSYRVTMHWLETIEGKNEEWYCWGAQVNGMPGWKTYSDYHSERKDGEAVVVFGEGFWAENEEGLLCDHTHMKESQGGNVAGRLSATVHIPDFACALVPDYQRDLAIDAADTARWRRLESHSRCG